MVVMVLLLAYNTSKLLLYKAQHFIIHSELLKMHVKLNAELSD
jgi:hypothetical protein